MNLFNNDLRDPGRGPDSEQLTETRGKGVFRRLLFVFILFVFCGGSIATAAQDIDYQSLQEDPVETAFRRLMTQEVPEWDEGAALGGGDLETLLHKMQWPLKEGRIAGLFNLRAAKGRRKHNGVDLLAPKGTPIYAVLDGVVEVVANGGRGWRGYGRVIFINHGNELWSLYSHCDTIGVKMGQAVKQGDKIATVGRTGRATGNHLHFELRNKSGTPIDPMKFLPKEGTLPSAYK